MNYELKEIEKNRSEFKITIEKPAFDVEVLKAYKRNVGRFNIPGFRKGKAPKSIIEKMYGSAVFYDDAIDALLPSLYEAAITELKLDVVSRPELDVEKIDDEGVVIVAKVWTKPIATVVNYRGLEVEKQATVVTDEDITREIDQARRSNSRMLEITDRPAENGDIAVIDFEGFVDGVAFEGGKAEKYNLTLGSGSFIPGFEDQIVGKNIGDKFDVNVTFPADYGKEDLAGKPAVFKIVLHELKKNEIPELDDEFVKEVSEKSNTVAEYKEEIKAKITERKDKANERAMEEKLIDALNAVTEVDIPEAMIDAEVDNEVRDYAYRLQSQGGSLEMYFQYTGMDEKGLRDSLRPGAERQVKTRLALEAIVKTENITPTDEEIEEEYRKIASGYTVDIEKVKASIPVESLSEDIVLRKAVDLVKENAKITVAVPEEAPKAAKKTRAKKAETADGEEKTEAKPKRTKKAAEPKAEDKAE